MKKRNCCAKDGQCTYLNFADECYFAIAKDDAGLHCKFEKRVSHCGYDCTNNEARKEAGVK